MVIPVELRDVLELRDGDELSVRVEDRRLVLERGDEILARVQERIRRAVPADVSLVDELLAERRAAAAREAGS